ncbi:hypothetical protein KKG66_09695 [bacterium]|nr:hypothetical protein [bacterium]MBU1921109.1 hypothetical protein [bacterium]
MSPQHLGKHAQDKITGFKGIVTGEIAYITGCDQILIQPQGLDDNGKPFESRWFDISRCEIGDEILYEPLRQVEPGADRPGGPGDENPTDHVR